MSSSGVAAVAARPVTTRVPTLGVSELSPGQKAIVRTVFQGSQIEEFEAVIVGVLHNGRADGDLILGRATSERVKLLGIAQGMSGSPVYVEGKLIGALSSGWQFSREPIFGITPIGEMLALLDHPSVEATGVSGGPSGAEVPGMSSDMRFGEFHWDQEPPPGDMARSGTSTAVTPRATGPEALSLPLACAGLDGASLDFARGLLGPLKLTAVPSGRAPARAPGASVPTIEPGSALAVDLLRGDLEFSAIGTVTWVQDGRVLAFGHPFFQSGDVRLPFSSAEIATIVASDAISFKLGMRGETVGAIQQDRRAGIAGRLGASPDMLPFSVAIGPSGTPHRVYRFETIEDRNLAPTLIAIASLNSVLESGGTGGNQSLRWQVTLHRKGAPPLVVSDVATGEGPTTEFANGVLAPLRFLFANPFGRLKLDSVSVRVERESGRAQWTLRNARVLDARVRPGGRVRIACDLERWRGERVTREIEMTMPAEAPDGRYTLWLGGGAELMRYEAQRLPGRFRPLSLDDAWRRLAQARPSDALYASLFARASEVSSDGRDYPELPGSALPLLADPRSGGERVRRGELAKLDERRFPLDAQMRGEIMIPIEVDTQAP